MAETGHVTIAERVPNGVDYPGMSLEMALPGSAVFRRTAGPVPLDDPSLWWSYVPGADWRHPDGPSSSIEGLEDHPMVYVAYADAEAYATWAGKAVPTEAEWECAARGGVVGKEFAWGDELAPGGAMLANYWQGLFPFANRLLNGWEGTSPVAAFTPNGVGLHDMTGNVWEWTADWYVPGSELASSRGCCTPRNPRGRRQGDSVDRRGPDPTLSKALKGGSYLCTTNYCQRYRPAARHPEAIDSSTGHIGFRCVVRDDRSGSRGKDRPHGR